MRKTVIKTLAVLMIAGFSSQAMAAKWVEYNRDREAVRYYDSTGITSGTSNQGNKWYMTWFKTDYKVVQRTKSGQKYDSMTSQDSVVCATNRIMNDAQYLYYKGKLVQKFGSDNGFSDIIPDTIGAEKYKILCN